MKDSNTRDSTCIICTIFVIICSNFCKNIKDIFYTGSILALSYFLFFDTSIIKNGTEEKHIPKEETHYYVLGLYEIQKQYNSLENKFNELNALHANMLSWIGIIATLAIATGGIIAPILINKGYEKQFRDEIDKLKTKFTEQEYKAELAAFESNCSKILTEAHAEKEHATAITLLENLLKSIELRLERDERTSKNQFHELRSDIYNLYGIKLYLSNNFIESISYFSKSITFNAQNAIAYYHRGLVHDSLGGEENTNKAYEDYSMAIQIDKNFALPYINRALILESNKEYDMALDDLNRSIILEPSNALAFKNRGKIKQMQKNFEEALSDYNMSIKLNPEDAMTYYNRGTATSDMNHALCDFNIAIGLKPTYSKAYFNRGSVLHRLFYYEDAIRDFDMAISLDRAYVEAYNNRGVCRMRIDEYEKAIDDFDVTISLSPLHKKAFANRGICKYELGDYSNAILDYEQAIIIDRDFMDAYILRGDVYAKLNENDKAIADYEHAIELGCKDYKVYSKLGDLTEKYSETSSKEYFYNKAEMLFVTQESDTSSPPLESIPYKKKMDMLHVAYYFSRYGHNDVYPNLKQFQAFEHAAESLEVEVSTLRNMRDLFDGHNDSHRKGCYQKPLSPEMQNIKNKCDNLSQENILKDVKRILKLQ